MAYIPAVSIYLPNPFATGCRGYDIIQGMWSTPSLPLLPGPLWPGVVVHVRVLSMAQIELFDHLLRIIIIINYLKPYSCVQIVCIR